MRVCTSNVYAHVRVLTLTNHYRCIQIVQLFFAFLQPDENIPSNEIAEIPNENRFMCHGIIVQQLSTINGHNTIGPSIFRASSRIWPDGGRKNKSRKCCNKCHQKLYYYDFKYNCDKNRDEGVHLITDYTHRKRVYLDADSNSL